MFNLGRKQIVEPPPPPPMEDPALQPPPGVDLARLPVLYATMREYREGDPLHPEIPVAPLVYYPPYPVYQERPLPGGMPQYVPVSYPMPVTGPPPPQLLPPGSYEQPMLHQQQQQQPQQLPFMPPQPNPLLPPVQQQPQIIQVQPNPQVSTYQEPEYDYDTLIFREQLANNQMMSQIQTLMSSAPIMPLIQDLFDFDTNDPFGNTRQLQKILEKQTLMLQKLQESLARDRERVKKDDIEFLEKKMQRYQYKMMMQENTLAENTQLAANSHLEDFRRQFYQKPVDLRSQMYINQGVLPPIGRPSQQGGDPRLGSGGRSGPLPPIGRDKKKKKKGKRDDSDESSRSGRSSATDKSKSVSSTSSKKSKKSDKDKDKGKKDEPKDEKKGDGDAKPDEKKAP